jgi:hypothetical protein
MSDFCLVRGQGRDVEIPNYFPSVRSIIQPRRGSGEISRRASVEFANEIFCTWLANSIQLPVDTWQLWKEQHHSLATGEHGLCFEGGKSYIKPTSRLCYASWLPPDTDSSKCYEIIPSSWQVRVANRNDILGMLVFDLWIAAKRYRPVVYVGQADQTLHALFLSHGNVFNICGKGNIHFSPSIASMKSVLNIHYHALAGWTDDAIADWVDRLRSLEGESMQQAFDYAYSNWQPNGWEAEVREFLWKRSSLIDDLAESLRQELKHLK